MYDAGRSAGLLGKTKAVRDTARIVLHHNNPALLPFTHSTTAFG